MEDAADSKSAEVYPSWGFESPLRHQSTIARNLQGAWLP